MSRACSTLLHHLPLCIHHHRRMKPEHRLHHHVRRSAVRLSRLRTCASSCSQSRLHMHVVQPQPKAPSATTITGRPTPVIPGSIRSKPTTAAQLTVCQPRLSVAEPPRLAPLACNLRSPQLFRRTTRQPRAQRNSTAQSPHPSPTTRANQPAPPPPTCSRVVGVCTVGTTNCGISANGSSTISIAEYTTGATVRFGCGSRFPILISSENGTKNFSDAASHTA